MVNARQTTESQPPARPFHETTDVNPRLIVFFGAGLLMTVLAAMILTYLLFAYSTGRYAAQQPPASPLAYTRAPTPEPHLTINAPEELRRLHANENNLLNNYSWIDKESGSVRIPIDRAIQLMAQKGLQTRPELKQKDGRVANRYATPGLTTKGTK